MLLSRLLDPVTGRWLRRAQGVLDDVPQPSDAPRRVAPGPNADRVLLAGNGHVTGFGVRTHELAMTGQLARRLAARTGRGAVVDVAAQRGLTIDRAGEVLRGRRLSTYDAVVLSLGATDAASLTPPHRWRAGLVRLLDQLRADLSAETAVVLLAIRPVERIGARDTFASRRIAAHAERLDRVTAEVLRERGDVLLLEADGSRRDGARTPEEHLRDADRLAEALTDRLDEQAASPSASTSRARRRGPDPEVLRQAAVDRTGLAGTGSNAVLDRLLQQARDLFGVTTAVVTLVDGDLVTAKASLGASRQSVPRSIAPCTRTIRQEGALVVPDLAGEPIADLGPRFYAGHPLESPDGYRIGTLCIFDPAPRPAGVDRVALMELASRVEAELWRQIQEGDAVRASKPDVGSLRMPSLSLD